MTATVEYLATCDRGSGFPDAVWYGTEDVSFQRPPPTLTTTGDGVWIPAQRPPILGGGGTRYDRVDCPRCMAEEGAAA
jgi:hypothetical protein